MLKILKAYASNIFSSWVKDETKTFTSFIEAKKAGKIIDFGCGDGRLTGVFAKKSLAAEVTGVEMVNLPRKYKKMKVVKSDLNRKLPFKSNYFDIVFSHFSIEHLYNTGIFLSECRRILKKGGYMLVATDNLSSWPNVISLFLGWQPFSTTNGIGKGVLGNPLALRANYLAYRGVSGEAGHNKVMAYRMLIDAFLDYGFTVEKVAGVGYFPFSGILSKIFCLIDRRHAHFLILKARK